MSGTAAAVAAVAAVVAVAVLATVVAAAAVAEVVWVVVPAAVRQVAMLQQGLVGTATRDGLHRDPTAAIGKWSACSGCGNAFILNVLLYLQCWRPSNVCDPCCRHISPCLTLLNIAMRRPADEMPALACAHQVSTLFVSGDFRTCHCVGGFRFHHGCRQRSTSAR